jgi:small-conductance mechanosensitive channel
VPAIPAPSPAAASSLLRVLPTAIAATGFALLAWAGRAGNWPAPLPALREPLSNLLLSLAALAAAMLLVQALGWLVWDRLVPRYSGLRLPRLLRQFVAVLVMAMDFVGVLAQVWNVALPAVLATTGVIGLVLGLALRRILTDFFLWPAPRNPVTARSGHTLQREAGVRR